MGKREREPTLIQLLVEFSTHYTNNIVFNLMSCKITKGDSKTMDFVCCQVSVNHK